MLILVQFKAIINLKYGEIIIVFKFVQHIIHEILSVDAYDI